MTAFTLGEFMRSTLLGACLGVAPLALFVSLHHLFQWIGGETYDAPVLFLARFGVIFLTLPIIVILWPIATLPDPLDWKNLMFLSGLIMVGTAYLILARRWGLPRPHKKGDTHERDHGVHDHRPGRPPSGGVSS